jgi:hypothetical protein
MATKGPTIKIGEKDYDVNRDFSWRELLTVEELGGVPLGRDGSFESMSVMAAFVFVVLKRDDVTLEWAGFLDRNIEELFGSDDEDETPKPKAKPRPTKSA